MASLKENKYKTINTIEFASPNFKPGIKPLNKGIKLSNIFKTTDKESNIVNLVNFFSSINHLTIASKS